MTIGPIDFEEARRFLTRICGDTPVTFQTFSDRKDLKNGGKDPNAAVYHGLTDDTLNTLERRQYQGAGAYFMVNQGDGNGRTAANVTRTRAVCVDLDGAPLEPVTAAGLPPHIVVESSPDRFHAYWITDPFPLEMFTPIQKAAAARFNGDKSIHDLPRVMRLPGFWHLKGDPFKTRILSMSDAPPYTLQEVVEGLGLETGGDRQQESGHGPDSEDPFHGSGEGGRTKCIERTAGVLFSKGYTLDNAVRFCETLDTTQNRPPLAETHPGKVQETVTGIHRRYFEGKDTPDAAAWGEPRLWGEMDTPDLLPDLLPGFLGDFCKAVALTTQTPAGMAVMYALAVVATCLQKRFEVSPYHGGHQETLSLWTVTALDPGNRKTAVKNALTEPLAEWERDQGEAHREEITRKNSERAVYLKRQEKLREKAAKADDPVERAALIKDLAETTRETPEEVFLPRLFTGDVTPERLQGLLCDHGERMALLSDEGGIFEVMAGLYSDGKANIDTFLQAHPGAPVRVDRGTRTVTLHRPALSFGLTVQPDIISDLGSKGKRKFRGNGCLARFLFCIPRSTVGTRDVRARNPIPEGIRAAFRDGIRRLLDIQPVHDDQGREQARILTLSPAALDCWYGFSEYLETRMGDTGDLHPVTDWASKLPGAALRIAGLMHVVEHGEQTATIDAGTMEKALDLAEALIPHAQAAFDLMGADPADRDAKAVLKWIQRNGAATFRQKQLFDAGGPRQIRDKAQAEKALEILTARDIISEPRKTLTGGRPSVFFAVNPAVLTATGKE